jgi:hypothetical protein
MEDIDGMESLLRTSNIAIIKKLQLHIPYETNELLMIALNNMINKTFLNVVMIRWLIDNLEIDQCVLNWLFGSLIKINEYQAHPHKLITDSTVTKLINMGAHVTDRTNYLFNCGIIFLQSEDFFNYEFRYGFEVDTEHMRFIFYDSVKIDVRDHIYNEWKEKGRNMDDIYVVLKNAIQQNKNDNYENIVIDLISMVQQIDILKRIILCIANTYVCTGITEYVREYDFYEELVFYEKVMWSVRYQRGTKRDDLELNDMIAIINTDEEALQLYIIIIDNLDLVPSKIDYDKEMHNVRALQQMIQ